MQFAQFKPHARQASLSAVSRPFDLFAGLARFYTFCLRGQRQVQRFRVLTLLLCLGGKNLPRAGDGVPFIVKQSLDA